MAGYTGAGRYGFPPRPAPNARVTVVGAQWPRDVTRFVLSSLQPDVHAKGTDFSEDTVPERAVTAEIGGRPAIVGDRKDHSSTDLIRKIRASARGGP